MAMPIKPTPVLDERETEQFQRKIAEKEGQKSYPKSNQEKLRQAKEKAARHALGRKKQDR